MRKLSKLLVVLGLLALVAAPVLAGELAKVSFDPTRVQWDPQVDYDRAVLTVSTPDGIVLRQELEAGQSPMFDLSMVEGAKNGAYTYELRLVPRIDPEVRKALADARRTGDEAAMARLQAGLKAGESQVMSGSFRVQQGSIVDPAAAEPHQGVESAASASGIRRVTADEVIPEDLIVQGSVCIGLDCGPSESFGFDTIRLKENNTRIKFEDTSVGSFPSNDWQLTANDSVSGGSSKFSIEDITGAKVPFTVTAGAPTNSIFVDSTGRVGFRTSTPVLDLHVNTGNTPALRLEQNSSGGFTAQTWDVGGNEVNFFIRDPVTSRLPFRIRPGAPTSSIDISSIGSVGLGTASPGAKLHVFGADSGTTRTATFENNGNVLVAYVDSSTSTTWGVNLISSNGNMRIAKAGSGVFAFELQGNGTQTNAGSVNATAFNVVSDRNLKKGILPVRGEEVLAKLAALPISTWTFKTDDIQHVGPMAQDFVAAFGLGPDDKHISVSDMAGVSLAAIQALNKQVTEKDAQIEALQKQNDDMARRLADLEAKINALASQK